MRYKILLGCNKNLLFFLAFMNFFDAFAQTPGVWETYGPYLNQPRVNGLFVRPENPQILYALTDGGMYRSLDLGLTWELPEIFQNLIVRQLVLADSIIYAQSGGKILKITENGTKLSEIMSLNDPGYTDIYLLQSIESIVYVAYFHTLRNFDTFRLRFSKNGGQSWQDAQYAGSTFQAYFTSIHAINGIICASTKHEPYGNLNPTKHRGIFYSKDGGLTWEKARTTLPEESVTAIIPADGKLYANTAKKILVSSDGINWLEDSTGIQNEQLTIIKSINKNLFAGTENSGLFRSTNQGMNWEQIRNDSLNNKHITTIVESDGIIYAGTKATGVFKSTDGGLKWAQANSPMNDKDVVSMVSLEHSIYVATGLNGIFRTTDGEHWFDITREFQIKIGCEGLVVDLNYIITYDHGNSSSDGVFISKDGGRSWVQANHTLLNGIQITSMINSGSTVWIGTEKNGILISTDGGKTWIRGGTTINDSRIVNLFLLDGILYAAVQGNQGGSSYGLNGIFYSLDEGRSWIKINSPLDNTLISTMFSWHGVHFAGTNLGLFRSFDRGVSWSSTNGISSDIQANSFTAIAETLYVVAGKSVFRSTNDGLSWTKRNEPFVSDGSSFIRVYILFSVNTTLFAGINSLSLDGTSFFYALLQSLDGGLTWVIADAPLSNAYVGPISRIHDSLYLAAYKIVKDNQMVGAYSNFLGIKRCKDGRNWYPLSLGIESLSGQTKFWGASVNYNFLGLNRLAYLTDLNRLYAATNNGVYLQELDVTPPLAEQILINDGKSFTNKNDVSLSLRVLGADYMRITEAPAFLNTPWQPYRENISITLSIGDGPKFIYTQFRDISWNISSAFDSILLDTQPPTFSASLPQLSVTIPSLNQAVAVSLAAPTDGSGSGIKSFVLYYRRAGENWENQNKSAFQNNLVQIPSQLITNRGLDYQIVAEDSAGNSQPLRNGNLDFFSIPVSIRAGEVGSSPGLPGGTSGSAYRLISLPLMVENKPVSEIFTDLGTYGIDKDYFFWRYEGGNTWRDGANITVQPGESYFLIRRKSGSLSNQSAGTTAKATDAVLGNIIGWQLRANDWTLVGNPFNFEISLTDLWLKNRDTSLVFVPDVWSYDGGSINKGWTKQNLRLSPWGGLAIYNAGATDTLIFTPSSSPTSLAAKPLASFFDTTFSQDEWGAQIRAESRGFQDNENYIGVRKEAQTNQDEFDLYEPPLVPGGVSLNFTANNSEPRRSLAADIRPLNETGYEWTLQLKGVGGSEVKLNLEELATLPTETKIYLLDRSSRLLRDLRKQPEIVVYLPQSTATKTMTILVGEKAFVEKHSESLQAVPTTFALHQNYPNPFNPTTVIRYELPVAGKVTLKIYNLLGTEVSTLENDEPHDAGFYERVVDLRQFAAGIYFYRISVSGEKRFEATKKMVFTK